MTDELTMLEAGEIVWDRLNEYAEEEAFDDMRFAFEHNFIPTVLRWWGWCSKSNELVHEAPIAITYNTKDTFRDAIKKIIYTKVLDCFETGGIKCPECGTRSALVGYTLLFSGLVLDHSLYSKEEMFLYYNTFGTLVGHPDKKETCCISLASTTIHEDRLISYSVRRNLANDIVDFHDPIVMDGCHGRLVIPLPTMWVDDE